MDEGFVDTHDGRHVRCREPSGKISDGFQIERAVFQIDHRVIETGRFDDPRHAARGKFLDSGAERGTAFTHSPAYAVFLHAPLLAAGMMPSSVALISIAT